MNDPMTETAAQTHREDPVRNWIDAAFDAQDYERTDERLTMLARFREALNQGVIRAAEPAGGYWHVHAWVKKGVFLHRALGVLTSVANGCFEMDTFPLRNTQQADLVRTVSTATVIRDGVYLAPGVSCIPPAFVNIGAWIGRDSVLDSHALVGACAQIGERVQIGAAAQIGGHIEPVDVLPVIIGDDVVMGGQCGVYDGAVIGAGAVLAAGTMLTAQTRVYDGIRKQIYEASAHRPLVIPPMAILMPGARQLSKGKYAGSGLLLHVPVVVGYRDDPSLPASLLDEFMD